MTAETRRSFLLAAARAAPRLLQMGLVDQRTDDPAGDSGIAGASLDGHGVVLKRDGKLLAEGASKSFGRRTNSR